MCVRCHHLVTRDVIKPLYSDRQSVTTALKQTQKEIRQKCTASYLQSFIFPVPFIYSLLIRHVLLLHRQRFVTLCKLSDTGKPLRFRGNMTSCCVFFFFGRGGSSSSSSSVFSHFLLTDSRLPDCSRERSDRQL